MANVNKTSFRTASNQKVIVEELIEVELKGIVGGVISETVSEVTAISTNGTDAIIQDSNQEVVKNNVIRRKRKRVTLINGVKQILESQEIIPI